ncbi:GCN5-related N-acetyltransferase 6, chloroplastic-like isoform X1 [Curcuma longa]|uniref:GCN5-related N-acetyltransferase 6, chloroplastic-like isoform X1 n=1 Tax=Curcuma longa TaxID=136217 RepID=UPI003D9DC92D
MTAVAAPLSGLRRSSPFHIPDRRKPCKTCVFAVMKDGSVASSATEGDEGNSSSFHTSPKFPQLEMSSNQSNLAPKILKIDASYDGSNFRFDRPQPSDEEGNWKHTRAFGRFIAREALLNEELWAAAWLRAECHWENCSDVRYPGIYKRQFANKEFDAIKKRCSAQQAEKCICIVAQVKKDDKNSKRTALSSIIGTLDLSIRQLLVGETFPLERIKQPAYCSIYQADQPKYAYISDLCVSKHYRRKGIAKNMLLLANEAATTYGIKQVFVQVHRDNTGAQKLYDQIGFQIVPEADRRLVAENRHLLSLQI